MRAAIAVLNFLACCPGVNGISAQVDNSYQAPALLVAVQKTAGNNYQYTHPEVTSAGYKQPAAAAASYHGSLQDHTRMHNQGTVATGLTSNTNKFATTITATDLNDKVLESKYNPDISGGARSSNIKQVPVIATVSKSLG